MSRAQKNIKMKNQLSIFLLLIGVAIIFSCNQSGQKTNNSNSDKVSIVPKKSECFSKRVKEHGGQGVDTYSYGASECSLSEFNARVKEHGGEGVDTYSYAMSKHTLSEFNARVKEYGGEGVDTFYYAASEHSLSEFKARVKEYGGEGWDTFLYAYSNNELCR